MRAGAIESFRVGNCVGGERERSSRGQLREGGRDRNFRAGNCEGAGEHESSRGQPREEAGEGGARGRRFRAGNQAGTVGIDSRSSHRAGNCAVERFRASLHRVITRATEWWIGEEAATPRRPSIGQPKEGVNAETPGRNQRVGNYPVKVGRFRIEISFGYPDGIWNRKDSGPVIVWATEG